MATRSRPLLLSLALTMVVTACGSTGPTTRVTAAPASTNASSPSSAAPSPANSSASPSASLAAGQSDTDWGRIWDSVPAGFPRFPGSTLADDAAADPVSASFGVPGGDPKAIATWMQGALEAAHLDTIGLNGPGEDGSFVLDSVGQGRCRVQTTVAPLGDMTFISVLYGSDCPATQL